MIVLLVCMLMLAVPAVAVFRLAVVAVFRLAVLVATMFVIFSVRVTMPIRRWSLMLRELIHSGQHFLRIGFRIGQTIGTADEDWLAFEFQSDWLAHGPQQPVAHHGAIFLSFSGRSVLSR